MKSVRTTNRYNRPVRNLCRLLRGITLNHIGDFYCLSCLHSFCTDNVLKIHDRLCEKRNYCHVKMPTEDNKLLKFSHGEKSLKDPFMITFDLECLLKKEQSCQNNPEKTYTEKKTEYESSGYSWDLVCSFDPRENKHNFYRGTVLKNFVKI